MISEKIAFHDSTLFLDGTVRSRPSEGREYFRRVDGDRSDSFQTISSGAICDVNRAADDIRQASALREESVLLMQNSGRVAEDNGDDVKPNLAPIDCAALLVPVRRTQLTGAI
jgi:hypothetical protein